MSESKDSKEGEEKDTKESALKSKIDEIESNTHFINFEKETARESAIEALNEDPNIKYILSPSKLQDPLTFLFVYREEESGKTIEYLVHVTPEGFEIGAEVIGDDGGLSDSEIPVFQPLLESKFNSLNELLSEFYFVDELTEEEKKAIEERKEREEKEREKEREEAERKQQEFTLSKIKIAIEAYRNHELFKNLSEPEARKQLAETKEPLTMIIPTESESEFLLIGRVPPFPTVSNLMDLKKIGIYLTSNPEDKIKRASDALLSDQRNLLDLMKYIRIHHNYEEKENFDHYFKNISAEEAAKELSELTVESYRIVPGKEPNTYIFAYRLPPLDVTFHTIPLPIEFFKLRDQFYKLIREEESIRKIAKEIEARSDERISFKRTSEKEVLEELDTTAVIGEKREKIIIIPGEEENTYKVLIAIYNGTSVKPTIGTIAILNPKEFILDNEVVTTLDEYINQNLEEMKTALRRIEEIRSDTQHFKSAMTADEAKDALDLTFKEDMIVIPNTDGSFECYLRVPPITQHKTYQPSGYIEFKKFVEQFTKELHEEVQNRRNAGTVDLKAVSEQSESSMQDLSGSEVGVIGAIRAKYEKKMEEMGGLDAVVENYKKYLESKYNDYFEEHLQFLEKRFKELEELTKQLESMKKEGKDTEELKKLQDRVSNLESMKKEYDGAVKAFPEIFKNKKLPLEYNEKYNHPYIQKLYFDNPFHSAWRYFLNPNPWITKKDPNDVDVWGIIRTENASQALTTWDPEQEKYVYTHADLSEDSKTDLALLWLAASDTTVTPAPGFTNDGMMENFTREVGSYIGRAHNFDAVDKIRDESVKQKMIKDMILKFGHQTDDQLGDDPTCLRGVNKRLLQSVQGHPITSTPELNSDIVQTKYAELVTDKFSEYLNDVMDNIFDILNKRGFDKKAVLENQIAMMKQFHEAYEKYMILFDEDYEELSDAQKVLLKAFRIDPKDMLKTSEEMAKVFGEQYQWKEMSADVGGGTKNYLSYEHFFHSLNPEKPWDSLMAPKLEEMMKARIQSLEMKLEELLRLEKEAAQKEKKEEKKERKEGKVKSMIHAYELKAKKEEVKDTKPKPKPTNRPE